jgi:hypothetical protein
MTFRIIASTAVLCLALPFAASAQNTGTGQTGVTTGQTGPAAVPAAPPAAQPSQSSQSSQSSVSIVVPFSGTVGIGSSQLIPDQCAGASTSEQCKTGQNPRSPRDDLQSTTR